LKKAMAKFFSFRWRGMLALGLQALLIVQLLAVPASGQPTGDWVEICTADGMVKKLVGGNDAPDEPTPAHHGHEGCDLCLPSHAAAPALTPGLAAYPADYRAFRPADSADDSILPIPTGPPIGARGPPALS